LAHLTVTRLLAERAASEGNRAAMIVDGAEPLTFAAWHARSIEVAGGLVGRGVRRGDRIGLIFGAGSWLDYAVAFCGVLASGAVAVPLSDRHPAADLEFKLAHSGAVGVLSEKPVAAPKVWQARVDELTGPGDLPPPDPGDLAQILYTSGTTGRPKGVAASHANLAYGCGRRRRAFAHSRHLAHAFPIGTNAGQTMLINALDATPAVVTPDRITPGRFAALIDRYQAGTVFLVPAMAMELLGSGVRDLTSVLLLGSSAAPLPAAVARRLPEVFPNATIANYYNSTESGPAQTIMLFDPDRPDSVGRAMSGGSVRIATADGQPLPPGAVGEVWLFSPAAQRGYHGDPASPVFRDGWVRMGDLGRLDADGYLYLVDRHSDVVKSAGYKVSTIQVEEALFRHPAVVDAAAFGVPHPVLGTAIAAAVVTTEPVSAPALRRFLAEWLAPQEIPAYIHTVDALPRNQGGKVDKRVLTERFPP
jgi:acyl-CoA synthetase (AMP-forming)/AMP-acid ligase II